MLKKSYPLNALEEANLIKVDKAFVEDILFADTKASKEKLALHIKAFRGLLIRNNITAIRSDFWKVFRILKDRIKTGEYANLL